MLSNNRVILNKSGTLTDLSVLMNNLFSGSHVVDVAASDFIYLGSDLPFNHRYLSISTANDQACAVSVDIWDGNSWQAAVDVVDQTDDGTGKTLSQSGIISFSVDKSKGWGFETSTEDMSSSGLQTLKIYNMYWVRLKFSATVKNTTALKYVGHKFANDIDLAGKYPDLIKTSVLTSFQSGKTSWEEQHILAAETIVRDLRKKQIGLFSASQILNWEVFNDAAVYKVAEMIFLAFGDDYADDRKLASQYYEDALDQVVFPIDKNQDGRLDPEEQRYSTRLIRG